MFSTIKNRYSHRKTLILVNILSLLFFLFITYLVVNNSYLLSIDRWVNIHIRTLHTPILTYIIIFITNLCGVVGNVVFGTFVMVFLTYKKWYKERLFYLLSFSGAVVLFAGIKQLVARSRPSSDLIDVINYSFPSGHSTLSMATVLLIYFIFDIRGSSVMMKNILLTVGVTCSIFIAFTRIYLNVHWLSDVLVGLALGIFWVTLIRLFFIKNKSLL